MSKKRKTAEAEGPNPSKPVINYEDMNNLISTLSDFIVDKWYTVNLLEKWTALEPLLLYLEGHNTWDEDWTLIEGLLGKKCDWAIPEIRDLRAIHPLVSADPSLGVLPGLLQEVIRHKDDIRNVIPPLAECLWKNELIESEIVCSFVNVLPKSIQGQAENLIRLYFLTKRQ